MNPVVSTADIINVNGVKQKLHLRFHGIARGDREEMLDDSGISVDDDWSSDSTERASCKKKPLKQEPEDKAAVRV